MRKESFKWAFKNGAETKASFNKIQSWLEELQAVEDTQRMLLRGGSKKLQGSMLRTKSSKSMKKHRHQNNFIEIDNETKIFKISEFGQTQFLSKTFMPFQKAEKEKQRFLTAYSEGISPRQISSSKKFTKTSFPSKQRELLKLNTKEFLFKMKKIKRIQSSSQPKSIQSNRDKISKILSWKAQLMERSNGLQTKPQNEKGKRDELWSQSKIKTSPSTPKIENRKIDKELKEKLQIKTIHKGKQVTDVSHSKFKIGEEQKGRQLRKNKEQKVDPRIKLQLQIAKKLFCLQQNSKHSK